MKLFGRKRPQRSADTSEKSPETVNVQSRDVSVAESDTEMMTEKEADDYIQKYISER